MQPVALAVVLLVLASVAYYLGRGRSLRVANGSPRVLHSLPTYYGFYTALWCGIPALLLLAAWIFFEPTIVTKLVLADLPSEMRELPEARLDLLVNDIKNVVAGSVTAQGADPDVSAAAARYRHLQGLSDGGLGGLGAFARGRRAGRTHCAAFVPICAPAIASRRSSGPSSSQARPSRSLPPSASFCRSCSKPSASFKRYRSPSSSSASIGALRWRSARIKSVGSGAFGAVPLFTGTLLISGIAMAVAVPIGLMSAIYLSEYASRRFRTIAKPVLEVLAGIPTVVYGFFAALVVAPLIRDTGTAIGLDVSSESALAAGLVMGIMIIPFVSSLADDVINAVPQALRDGSYGIGATQSETIRQVVIPAALPGIVGGVLLAVSRAIGETMIVVMAAGLAANLTMNPLEAVTTVTVQIVTVLVGDQEFDSAKTLSAFALGLVLFVIDLGPQHHRVTHGAEVSRAV